jgi:hypothetical protein
MQIDTALAELEESDGLTPVHERREWLNNAFKKNTMKFSSSHSPIQSGLVHNRLAWIAEEKRKSLDPNSPNNKDASENIPPHLVKGRKEWLDEQLRLKLLHKQQLQKKHLILMMSQGEDAYTNEQQELVDESRSDDYNEINSTKENEILQPRTQVSVDKYDDVVFTEDEILNQRAQVHLYDDEAFPHDEDFPDDEQEAPTIFSTEHREDTAPIVAYKRPVYYLQPHEHSNYPANSTSPCSLADYARQSAQTMARARFAVVPLSEDELIAMDATSPRSVYSNTNSRTSSRASLLSPRDNSRALPPPNQQRQQDTTPLDTSTATTTLSLQTTNAPQKQKHDANPQKTIATDVQCQDMCSIL